MALASMRHVVAPTARTRAAATSLSWRLALPGGAGVAGTGGTNGEAGVVLDPPLDLCRASSACVASGVTRPSSRWTDGVTVPDRRRPRGVGTAAAADVRGPAAACPNTARGAAEGGCAVTAGGGRTSSWDSLVSGSAVGSAAQAVGTGVDDVDRFGGSGGVGEGTDDNAGAVVNSGVGESAVEVEVAVEAPVAAPSPLLPGRCRHDHAGPECI